MPILPKRIRDLSFWHYQIAGWLAMAAVQTSVTVTTLGGWKSEVMWRVLLEVLLGFGLTSVLRYFYRWVHRRNMSLFPMTALMVISSLVVAMVSVACFLLTMKFTGGLKMGDTSTLFLWLVSMVAYAFPDKLAWSGLYFGITFWRNWQDERDRAEQAAGEAQHAQLQMLRYRLNPRFLFDALTSARALVDEDVKSARQVVTELSEFLRYSLMSRDKPQVLLKDELEAVRLYLSIEQRRYGDKLDIAFEISDETRDLQVPSYLIYPLVEHALQSAMETGRECVRLGIGTRVAEGALEITVTYPGKETEAGEERGLAWMADRLHDLFPQQGRMITQQNEGVTSLEMRLPLMNGEELEQQTTRSNR